MNSKLIPITKVFAIIMPIILVAMFFVILGLDKQNKEVNKINQELNISIDEQKNSINELLQNNEELNSENAQLIGLNNKLQDDNKLLQTYNQKILNQVKELESQAKKAESYIENLESQIKTLKENIAQLEENKKNESTIVAPSYNDFKSYLPYDAITNQWSQQWKLQQQAYTNEDGIRCIDGIPMVAVGTGWGLSVGDIALVTCENGNNFKVMIGDIKADVHTEADNKTTMISGCRCEFIVELNKLDPYVKSMGSLAVLTKYSGYVINIEKLVN